jgi:hypothetical protein
MAASISDDVPRVYRPGTKPMRPFGDRASGVRLQAFFGEHADGTESAANAAGSATSGAASAAAGAGAAAAGAGASAAAGQAGAQAAAMGADAIVQYQNFLS